MTNAARLLFMCAWVALGSGCTERGMCNETVAIGCEFSRELATELGCRGGANPGCASLCGGYAAGCDLETDAAIRCGMEAPASDYVCNDEGYPEPKPGTCSTEAFAAAACWANGGPNETVRAACENEAARSIELGCNNPQRCLGFYSGIADGCSTQVDALAGCGNALPTSSYECNDDGDLTPMEGVCNEEAEALLDCQLSQPGP